MRLVSAVLPWRSPLIIEGEGSVLKLPRVLSKEGLDRVLVVTDKDIVKLGLMDAFLRELEREGIVVTIYDRTVPNPTIANIEEAVAMYQANACNAIIAFGGGSAIDCAKTVGARIVKPKKSVREMKGLLKIMKTLPPLVAIPTTAGTGSEATIAAVVTDPANHEKYVITDISLIPHYAVLDPLLTKTLPPAITAATGMDALTHAVEAYIGQSSTQETRELSKKATKLIFENIQEVYTNGSNLSAREKMLKASYYAGAAFTKAYVGNVHAIAHALGGRYGTPHGLANAVILPHVLDYYGPVIYPSLAELADHVGIGDSTHTDKDKALLFIAVIKELNERMGIPSFIADIKKSDIPEMVERAYKEANPFYPVPVIFSKNDFEVVFRGLQSGGVRE
ncbi:iron-containing alcohol dehydrogenase [Paenalkalicoccus suaedae]|uniref:Iron-containing alcohol dehydrogenase n=1 Tax=Paenalkalicoccus suaedae TaxID=2592382 RepID=A0A859FK52_9BACI|nr:iron-containing alcohol dehydrogenase [Paenalkalicoccus suaedae]QKS73178.1 iron-containing alcohol dehydrogenase [Paenalkalicoccus suaedae]